ncbi:hypothetical protein BDN67DRAFT_983201 [Paxillus ammoniavirescens]|nr:hypothetical protein BDN67DRAFT_983201 [Paxillus ammoniavirescens]
MRDDRTPQETTGKGEDWGKVTDLYGRIHGGVALGGLALAAVDYKPKKEVRVHPCGYSHSPKVVLVNEPPVHTLCKCQQISQMLDGEAEVPETQIYKREPLHKKSIWFNHLVLRPQANSLKVSHSNSLHVYDLDPYGTQKAAHLDDCVPLQVERRLLYRSCHMDFITPDAIFRTISICEDNEIDDEEEKYVCRKEWNACLRALIPLESE